MDLSDQNWLLISGMKCTIIGMIRAIIVSCLFFEHGESALVFRHLEIGASLGVVIENPHAT
jgi:hypothetical protein